MRTNLKIFKKIVDLKNSTCSRTIQMTSPVHNSFEANHDPFKYRDKPFIVICGCTGTGKTKLSIQFAEWLIKNNRKAEIINADAMQVFS